MSGRLRMACPYHIVVNDVVASNYPSMPGRLSSRTLARTAIAQRLFTTVFTPATMRMLESSSGYSPLVVAPMVMRVRSRHGVNHDAEHLHKM
jgi:hypothetical protein